MFPVENKINRDTEYAGRSTAKVIDNRDPKKRGRIRVFHPYIGNSTWIDYLRLPGQFSVPEIDDLVYIEADAGWIDHPIAWGNATSGPDSSPNIPESFQRSTPTNRGIFTPLGHLFELDDGTGVLGTDDRGIRITSVGGKKLHISEDETAQNNKFLYEDENQNIIEVDAILNKITITTSNGALFEIDGTQDNISISTGSAGNSINMSQGNVEVLTNSASITVNASGDISVAGPVASFSMASSGDIEASSGTGTLTITSAGKVELAGVSDGVVALIQEFADTLSKDTFAGFGAPASSAAIYAQIALRAAAIKA